MRAPLLVVVGLAGLASSGAQERPKTLHLEPAALDLGHVAAGESVDATFDVVNDSDAPATIVKVLGNCACHTDLEVTRGPAPRPAGEKDDSSHPTLRPGDRATVRMTLDGEVTYLMRGDVKKPITVKLDPPGSLVCDLTLHVDPTFELEPKTFDFGIVHRGEQPERVLKFDAGALGKVKLGAFELPAHLPFDVTFRETTAAADAATRGELVARVHADEKRFGEFVGKGQVALDHPKVKALPLHFELALVPAFVVELDGREVTGRSAALGTFRAPDHVKKTLTIRTLRKDAPFAVKSARIESKQNGLADALTVALAPRADGAVDLVLSLEKPPPATTFAGNLVLLLDHPDVPDWRVAFTGLSTRPVVNPKPKEGSESAPPAPKKE